MFPCELPHHVDYLCVCKICTSLQTHANPLGLDHGVGLLGSAPSRFLKHLSRLRNHLELLVTSFDSGLVVSSGLHAVGAGHLESGFAVSKILLSAVQVTFRSGFGLCRGRLGGLLILQVLGISSGLVSEALLQHGKVVERICFRLAQTGQLLLGLLLQVLQHVDNALAVRFVDRRCRGSQLLVICIRALSRLHQGKQLLLVSTWKASCIHHGRQ
mmetsp:Transcript_95043/g.220614  ORF Transcript_95043/g.220614 Transcript_95043/m.220614 type:complete len:214 (+) Transcript_95043:1030-1671(+)